MQRIKGKSRLKTTRRKKAVDLVLRVLLAIGIITNIGLWGLVYDLTRVIKALPVPEAMVIEKTIIIIKEKPFNVSKNTQKIIDNNMSMTTKIKAVFGSDWLEACELIARESSFNPSAINPSSGACGLGQALPCSKMACSLDDVSCQLEWIDSYITARYGNVKKALEFHNTNGWY